MSARLDEKRWECEEPVASTRPSCSIRGAVPRLTVLVDARNVLRSQWPNIEEQRLVELCCSWATAAGYRAVLVFDGQAPGGLVGERVLGPHCSLVGSGAESADARLERAAAECRARGRRYWLVTSDRALRDAAGRHAERLVGGGTFARELHGSEPDSPRRERGRG